ncbi:MAG TPA: hypothetical protein VJT73_21790, partial [Polyangiaceae bacterium]|nr:hypothetical protein [Polyangiaceae bacterium]
MLTPPRFRTVLPVVVSLAVAGCHSRTNVQPGPKPATSQAPLRTVAVADDGFSTSVHRLLREGKPTPDRLGLLAGVVARQLKHASERFGTGQPELGLASITGALLLVRVGEFRMEMFEGSQTAFAAAIAEVAPRGDEGRAVAFLTMQNAISPQGSPARKDGEDHLAALRAWMIDTRKSNSLEALGGEQKVQAMRSLVEPTPESLEAAQSATVRWIEQSLKMKEDRRVGTTRPRREDELEAFRAFRSGAETLAALHLRHGDAKSALDSIDNSVARKVAPPSFYERLDRAANGGDAAAWKELLAWLWKDSPGSADSDPSLAVDPNVLKAALFGTALQAYRLDPTVADVNLALATLLVQIGLPEAVPPVLADAATLHPDPALLSASFRILLETILRESEADDILTARRVYTASRPLLTFASKPEFIGRVEPSAGRMQLAMGTIETRAGNLEAAKPLLESSSLSEPTVEALLKLAAIERQARQPDAALAQLTRALGTP